MRKNLVLTLALAGALSATFAAQAQTPVARERLSAAAASPLAAVDVLSEGAVARKDKAEAIFIGKVAAVYDTDYLDNGTPYRVVALLANKPYSQYHYIYCVGASANTTCGKLPLGKRVQFTTEVQSVQNGDDVGYGIFVATKLTT